MLASSEKLANIQIQKTGAKVNITHCYLMPAFDLER
jgi:hypothetical protein